MKLYGHVPGNASKKVAGKALESFNKLLIELFAKIQETGKRLSEIGSIPAQLFHPVHKSIIFYMLPTPTTPNI